MTLKCLIVDDEPLARECITNYIEKVDFLKLVGTGQNPLEVMRLLSEGPPDLIFLDIQMPFLNGIEFLKITQNLPMVVITTAFPEYALDGFQLNVMDYLLKPITFNRFLQSVTKAKDYFQLVSKAASLDSASSTLNYFFVKCGGKYERIYFHDVLFIEGMQNYVNIVTTHEKYMTLLSLKTVEQNLAEQSFIRVHRSFIVSIPKIDAVENNEVIVQSFRIPISRMYSKLVVDQVVNRNLWKKTDG